MQWVAGCKYILGSILGSIMVNLFIHFGIDFRADFRIDFLAYFGPTHLTASGQRDPALRNALCS